MSFYCSACGQTVLSDDKKCSCCSTAFGSEISPLKNVESGLFDFHGRIGRLSYFWIWFSALIIGTPASFFLRNPENNGGGFWLVLLMMLPLAYVAFAASVKRFHDLGKDGWWYITVFVPIFNFFVQIYLLFFKGEEGVNRFGPSPSGIGTKPALVISQYAQAVQAPIAAKAAPVSTAQSQEEMLSDDVLYEQIGVELESNNVDKAVWTRAFAMSEGDEKQTRVMYINLRFQKLKEQSPKTGSKLPVDSAGHLSDAPLSRPLRESSYGEGTPSCLTTNGINDEPDLTSSNNALGKPSPTNPLEKQADPFSTKGATGLAIAMVFGLLFLILVVGVVGNIK